MISTNPCPRFWRHICLAAHRPARQAPSATPYDRERYAGSAAGFRAAKEPGAVSLWLEVGPSKGRVRHRELLIAGAGARDDAAEGNDDQLPSV